MLVVVTPVGVTPFLEALPLPLYHAPRAPGKTLGLVRRIGQRRHSATSFMKALSWVLEEAPYVGM